MSHRRQIAAVLIGIALTAGIAYLYNHRYPETAAQPAQEPTPTATATHTPAPADALILRPTATPRPTRKPGPPRITNARLRYLPNDNAGIACMVDGTQPVAIHEEIAAGGIRWSLITAGNCEGWTPSVTISR